MTGSGIVSPRYGRASSRRSSCGDREGPGSAARPDRLRSPTPPRPLRNETCRFPVHRRAQLDLSPLPPLAPAEATEDLEVVMPAGRARARRPEGVEASGAHNRPVGPPSASDTRRRSLSPVTSTSARPATASPSTGISSGSTSSDRVRGGFSHDYGRLTKELVRRIDHGGGDSEFRIEHSAQLMKHGLARDERVIRDHDLKHIGAEASGGHSTDQNVRVEEYPQETSRKTSSSVRYPRASANGVIWRRRSANRSNAS